MEGLQEESPSAQEHCVCRRNPLIMTAGSLTINSPHSLLYLSLRGCVHFETLLCHVSGQTRIPPWSFLREPSRECRLPVNKHKGLAVKKGRPSSSRDVTLPRKSAQPLVTCLGFFSANCSFPLWFFFSLKHFPPPDSGKGNIFQSRNKLLLIALPCEYTVDGLCCCKNAPLIDVH